MRRAIGLGFAGLVAAAFLCAALAGLTPGEALADGYQFFQAYSPGVPVTFGQTTTANIVASGGMMVNQLATVTGLSLTDSATGGTLLHATQYCYRVSGAGPASPGAGGSAASFDMPPCAEVCITTSGGADTHSIGLSWNQVSGAVYYGVYGRGTGAELLMQPYLTASSSGTSFIDTGSITPTSAIPNANRTGGILAAANGGEFLGDGSHPWNNVYTNAVTNGSGLAPSLGQSTTGAWSVFASGTLAATTNYGAFEIVASSAGNLKFRGITCTHGTAGVGTAGTLAIRNVTDATTLCSGSYVCTTAANTPIAITDCNAAPTASKLYSLQFTTGCGTTQVSNMSCNVEMAR